MRKFLVRGLVEHFRVWVSWGILENIAGFKDFCAVYGEIISNLTPAHIFHHFPYDTGTR